MKRLFGLAAMLVLGGALVVPSAGAGEKKKPPSIKEIMTKAHKGASSQLTKAKAALKDKDYEELSAAAAMLVKLGGDLGKNVPPKGDPKNWAKLTSTYVKNAKALKAAADGKKEKAANTALANIGKMCGQCHSKHKGP